MPSKATDPDQDQPAGEPGIEPESDFRSDAGIEDPDAPERIRRILESPAYIRTDNDYKFLHRDELRHLRLMLEYLKPELIFEEHNIQSTIVVFGGTRIVKQATARREVERLQAAAAENSSDAALERTLRVAERVLAKSKYYDVAREFGRIVSESSKAAAPSDFIITTGGGPGIMEAANRGAFDAGRTTIGLNIILPMEQDPNAYITPELCFQFRYFALRKLHFLKRAKALVAFPGGYGTFDELFDALTLVQTEKIDPMPIVLVGEEFWRGAFRADFLAEEGVISPGDPDLVSYAETADQIWGTIREWYARGSSQ